MADLHDDLTAHVADELASADGSGQLAPLSDARLAEIRSAVHDARAIRNSTPVGDAAGWRQADAQIANLLLDAGVAEELLAYVDWLRERLLTVARGLVDSGYTQIPDDDDELYCLFCDGIAGEHQDVLTHEPTCIIDQARAALAAVDGGR